VDSGGFLFQKQKKGEFGYGKIKSGKIKRKREEQRASKAGTDWNANSPNPTLGTFFIFHIPSHPGLPFCFLSLFFFLSLTSTFLLFSLIATFQLPTTTTTTTTATTTTPHITTTQHTTTQ